MCSDFVIYLVILLPGSFNASAENFLAIRPLVQHKQHVLKAAYFSYACERVPLSVCICVCVCVCVRQCMFFLLSVSSPSLFAFSAVYAFLMFSLNAVPRFHTRSQHHTALIHYTHTDTHTPQGLERLRGARLGKEFYYANFLSGDRAAAASVSIRPIFPC